ncbi:MAG: ATP synthase F0 subunit C [Verrucomicrobia bacterium]|nr:ATP synthase F0 subunit C [Verrucomicrobiota bacterium]MBU4248138.1 ATP synthase F0 subunit C [Verrucomicrobiota bacterium]MBU4290275.1 ATP synthase F0 subunit C [Verrucomicrobiota bacterium]MBU4428712.1 ATP synthase F0 subunit C [Verrucomicrobiota bacterium]MBU4497957.1 ATP synthase F0 subunit C [Verrucomicrobiota bacterium]
MDILTVSVIIAGGTIGIGTLCTAIGQGMSVSSAMNGIARQPEASGTISTNLIIGLAFIESLAIYALVIALLLLFANPFAKAQNDVIEAKSKVELVKAEAELLQAQAQLDALKKQAAPAK